MSACIYTSEEFSSLAGIYTLRYSLRTIGIPTAFVIRNHRVALVPEILTGNIEGM